MIEDEELETRGLLKRALLKFKATIAIRYAHRQKTNNC